MELVRQISFSHVLPTQFKGCILVFEYSYFLLQQNGDTRNTLQLAVEEYQSSGTQATVLNALQHAINEYSNGYDVLMQTIFDIIVDNCMCKWFSSWPHKVSDDTCQQRSSFNQLSVLLSEEFTKHAYAGILSSTCYLLPTFSESHLWPSSSSFINCCKNTTYSEMQALRI